MSTLTPALPALSVGQVAKILGCSTMRVRRMAARGELPCSRTLSGLRLFSQDAVDALRERLIKPSGQETT